jgi:hypothetical protein
MAEHGKDIGGGRGRRRQLDIADHVLIRILPPAEDPAHAHVEHLHAAVAKAQQHRMQAARGLRKQLLPARAVENHPRAASSSARLLE